MSPAPTVVCISLPHRRDRRETIARRVRPHVPDLTFFDAIAPPSVPADILARMKAMPKAGPDAKARKAACFASHVAVLRRALDDDAFPLVVLEDDLVVPGAMLSEEQLAQLPRDSVCLLGGCLESRALSPAAMRAFRARAGEIAARMAPGVNPIDKATYRVCSSAAYHVPTRAVAARLLDDLLHVKPGTKGALTHYDIHLDRSSAVASLWFPSPFASSEEAHASDVMTSQTVAFTPEYLRAAAPASSRKRKRAA